MTLSSRGAPGIIDSSAEDLRPWQVERETREAEAVADAWASGDGIADLRVELAMDGVPAPSDGRWPQPKVATVLVCQLDTQAEEPTLGVLLARRDGCVLGPAEELAVRVQQTIQAAGWEHLPSGAILGDGAPGSWHVAAAAFPGGRQTLDDEHLSEHLDALAQLLYPTNPAGAKAWVDQQLGRLLMDHVGVVLSARKRRRPWQKAIGDALAQLIGDGERHPTRIRYQTPWPTGLAVGAGAGEGACKHGMHRRCKRAGLRWQQPGFRNVLAVRIAPLHGTFQAFWASRGLTVQGAG